MHAMVRKYAGKGGLLDGLAPKVRDGLVPLLRQAQGFRRYCAFASEDGHLVSVSAFDDGPTADAANNKVREWVAANLRDTLPDPPEVLAGEVRRELPGQGQSGAEGMYVVVRQYDGVRSIERLTALADEHVLPLIRQAPGLRGHYTFVSGEDQGRVVAVSLFDTRANAMRSSDQVVGIMRERAKEFAPNPPSLRTCNVHEVAPDEMILDVGPAALEALGDVLDEAGLAAVAAEVGADVPFFLATGPKLGEGAGERLRDVDIPQDYTVLVALAAGAEKPSTGEVYRRFDGTGGGPGFVERRAALLAALERRDLADAAGGHDLVRALRELGAFRADVTGAGPAAYGLFEERDDAACAAAALAGRGALWLAKPVW